MGKPLIAIFLSTCLFSSWVSAQSQSEPKPAQPPELTAFSSCLKAAVDAERTDGVSDVSLNRVKQACADAQRAAAQVLPPEIWEHMMVRLDESLLRELHR